MRSIPHDPYPQSSMILHDSLLCWCLVVPCDPDWSCDLQPAWKIWKAKTLSTSWDPGRSRFSYHCGMGLVEQYVVHLKFSLQPNTTCVYTQMWRGVVWCDTSWIYVYITYVIIYKNLLIHLPIIYYLYIITQLCSLKWSYESGGGRFEGRSETMKVSKKACQCSVWADATVHFLQEAFVSGIQCHLDPWGIWY
jgi:hypothetical protein